MPDHEIEQQLAFFHAHPPRTLARLICEPSELPGYPFDGHGEPINAVFSLCCPCGGIFFTGYGHLSEEEEVEPPPSSAMRAAPPVSIVCDACGASVIVFDPRFHGYDGASGLNAGLPSSRGPGSVLECDGVDSPYELFVRFEYPPDLLRDAPPGEAPSELYSWITLVGLADAQLGTLFEYECA